MQSVTKASAFNSVKNFLTGHVFADTATSTSLPSTGGVEAIQWEQDPPGWWGDPPVEIGKTFAVLSGTPCVALLAIFSEVASWAQLSDFFIKVEIEPVGVSIVGQSGEHYEVVTVTWETFEHSWISNPLGNPLFNALKQVEDRLADLEREHGRLSQETS